MYYNNSALIIRIIIYKLHVYVMLKKIINVNTLTNYIP